MRENCMGKWVHLPMFMVAERLKIPCSSRDVDQIAQLEGGIYITVSSDLQEHCLHSI